MRLRLMTHNIWNCTENTPAWAEKGFDCSAEARLSGILRTHRELMPDVIGCQEVSKKLETLVSEGLMQPPIRYEMIEGGYTPIFYRPDRLRLIESDFFRYSEKMEGYDGIFNDMGSKSYCIGVFEILESGKRFIFASTHLWWMRSPTPDMKPPYPCNFEEGSDEARAYQLDLLRARIAQMREKYDCPAFIVGDLNAKYYAPAVQNALAAGYVHAHDVAVEFADEAVGYHYCFADGFKEEYYNEPFEWAIDHILAIGTDADAIKRFARYSPDYYFPISDHSPAYIDVEI